MRSVIKPLIKKSIKILDFFYIIRFLKIIDDYIHGLYTRYSANRKFLFHGLSAMNYYMFEPLYQKIRELPYAEVYFCFSNYRKKNDFNLSFEPRSLGIPTDKIIKVRDAAWQKWDAVFDADFLSPHFYRNNLLIQIFHGVAFKTASIKHTNGEIKKIDYSCHPNLIKYDLALFINDIHCKRTKKAGLWKHDNSGEIIGMCCLDKMLKNNNPDSIFRLRKKYIPQRFNRKKIILYAPTWGENFSWNKRGAEIIEILSQLDIFGIIKPHPLCMNKIGNTSISIENYLANKFKNKNYLLITGNPYDAMNISDLLIADFSSLTLEYALLRKPIYLFVNNDPMNVVADAEQFDLVQKCCNCFREDDAIIKDMFNIDKITESQNQAMKIVEDKYFANVGHATERAIEVLRERNIISDKCTKS